MATSFSKSAWKIINWIDREVFESNSVYGTYWLFAQAKLFYLCDDYDPFLDSFLLRELVPDSMEWKPEVSSAGKILKTWNTKDLKYIKKVYICPKTLQKWVNCLSSSLKRQVLYKSYFISEFYLVHWPEKIVNLKNSGLSV